MRNELETPAPPGDRHDGGIQNGYIPMATSVGRPLSIETPPEALPVDKFASTGQHVLDRILDPALHSTTLFPAKQAILSSASVLDCIPNDRQRCTGEGRPEGRAGHALHQPSLGAIRSGALFLGTQNAAEDSKQYPVEVSIKHVNVAEGFLCGYLTIRQLTAEYPNLTTFFEGEIVGGPALTFLTNKWDADYEADRRHWDLFPYFTRHCQPYLERNYADALAQGSDDGEEGDPETVFHPWSHNVIFMRWKEHFLVPDHRIESVHGASYAGFYYIAYDVPSKTVSGFYYHRESRDYQRLELHHKPTKVFPSFEFR